MQKTINGEIIVGAGGCPGIRGHLACTPVINLYRKLGISAIMQR